MNAYCAPGLNGKPEEVSTVKLSKGVGWLTEALEDTLFVRQCDRDLYDLIMADRAKWPTGGAVVTGNSGIGLS